MTGVRHDADTAAVAVESARLLAAALRAPDADVPSCPGWSMRDLLVHTADVHRHKAAILERGGLEPPGADLAWTALPPAPSGGVEDLAGWFLRGADHLCRALAERDPTTPVWTWGPDQRVAFWSRRMAQETLIHRWDAEEAARVWAADGVTGEARSADPFPEDAGGGGEPLDPVLAADGVDEFLRVWLPDEDSRPWEGAPATVHVHCTDVEGEWLVGLGPDGVDVREGHARADAALRGPAADLLLVLFRRLPPDRVEHHGDPDVATRFLALTDTT